MARSSHPFSNPFGNTEEEQPRRGKPPRFFAPDRTEPTRKFEKLPEQIESSLNIEVASSPEEIVDYETKRVRWYLNKWKRYKELGYDSVIRLPASINPESMEVTDDEIRAAIQNEFHTNKNDYESYAETFKEAWSTMREKVIPIMEQIYGFQPAGDFHIVPTAYGTGGGSLEKDGPVFFRLPKFRPPTNGEPITEVEAITHEILCHEVTAHLREETAIDDSPVVATHQEYKERLMDLLGRTLLVRAGIMKREGVRMVGGGDAGAPDIDPLYYTDPEHPDENNLRYEGRLPDLIKDIETKLSQS
ncbi:hypothetical protein COU15_01615 [Candidatus Kaiserbacteria bacterium CG10_big_fil_rev_8_21_14_0_10_45_20]|uniref:Uncharacterized protein n=1 Tax=Candidatus Kaiserbacteria bacterium CG10_big_fil_rev_8_21_14_0_10_45_20 TaxID=1974607 RepID=A0A2H0UFU0_9BACT|nr:MAG: hypothetical protein COU15_01615 [Candidatus Kaiserbacteria bacterium CG10_big_fil_rev_8_21_14_0_10_45_20]